MLFTKWLNDVADRVLRKRTSKFAGKARRVSRNAAPQSSELLEARTLLTINVALSLGTLAIMEDGLGGANNLTVSADGSGNYVLKSTSDALNITSDDQLTATGNGTGTVTIGNSTVTSVSIALGDGSDTITVNSLQTGTTGFVVNGGAGGDVLKGAALANINLTGEGTVDGFVGSDSGGIITFDNIDSLVGNSGKSLKNSMLQAGTWSVSGASSSFTDGMNTLGFSGFAELDASASGDTFNVVSASTANLVGGTGNDIFSIGAKLTGSVDGRSGSDKLQGSMVTNAVLAATGTTDGFKGTTANVTGGFDNLDVITGSGTGTLTGLNVDSIWDFGASGTYTSTNVLTFDGFKTLQGGSGSDTFNVNTAVSANLQGGDGADTFNLNAPLTGSIDGQAGTDTLQGTGINDVTLTGAGVTGVSGNENSISGGFGGIDSLIGNGGRLTGIGVNSTWVVNGASSKYIGGGATLDIVGFTTLQGGSGVDTFNVTGDSTFVLDGGLGNDKITITATLTGTASGGGGNDTLDASGSTGAVTLLGGDGNDVVIGSAQNDSLDGGAGNDRIYGQAGDDTITGGAGNDSIVGGAGTDRLVETVTGNAVLTNTKLTGSNGTDTLSQMEQVDLIGSNGVGHSLDASAYTLGSVTLTGGDGNDTLAGGPNFGDVLDGGLGTDLVVANVAGVVTLTDSALTASGIVDSLANIELASLTGSAGADNIDASGFLGSATINGGAGNDSITGAVGPSALNGNNGNDTIVGQAGNDSILGGAGNDSLDGGEGNNRVNGQDGNDTIVAGSGNDTLTGDGGNDSISGGAGDDKIYGGAGNDTLDGGVGNDSVDGNDGNDSILGGDGADSLNGNAGNDTIVGGNGNDTIYGGAGNDLLLGDNQDGSGDGSNLIDGGAGNDTMIGGGGDDSLDGEQGNDLIFGGNGNDTLNGGIGNDTLLGGDGNDSILGGAGNDLCLGGYGGDDTINGQGGKDTLGGGGDQDVIYGPKSEIIDNATHDAFYAKYDVSAYLVP